MHQVNYDEPPDHDQMMAEDQHNCAGITSAGDGALKRPHLKDGATTGDDRKCQKTQLPVTLRIKYPIDVQKLRKYAATSAANTVRKHDDANPKGETDKVIIKQFLNNAKDGYCNVEYDHREIGSALIANGFLTHARHYSRQPYRNDAFELPSHLRAYALESLYYDFDDSKCFHRIIIGTASNVEAREIAEKLLNTEEGHKHPAIFEEIAAHYKKPVECVKDWFHALGNDQTVKNWKASAGIPADASDHPFIATYVEAQRTLTDELADNHPGAIQFIRTNYPTKQRRDENGNVVTVKRNEKTTWKAFYCQQFEAISRDVKIQYCKTNRIPYGPTQHDGIAISKTKTDGSPVDPEAVAGELTLAVSDELGFQMVVEVKPMAPTPIIDESRFAAAMFSSNYDCKTAEQFEQSLVGYRTLLSRYFVKILRHEKPTCVEVIFKDDEPSEFIIRSCKACMEIYTGLIIATTCSETENGLALGNFMPLVKWYLGDISNSNNYDKNWLLSVTGRGTAPPRYFEHLHTLAIRSAVCRRWRCKRQRDSLH